MSENRAITVINHKREILEEKSLTFDINQVAIYRNKLTLIKIT